MQDNPVGDHVLSWIGNGASVSAIAFSIMGWLPPIAAVIAFIWYCIQIYESNTAQKWLSRRRAKKIARLRAALVLLETTDAASPGGDQTV